jgi:putative addiction module component (TIGR02574 family)
MSDLQLQVGGLSTAEKFELLDALWESLEAETPVLTDEQSSEIDGRVASYRQNPSNVISWEQVKAGLFKKH